MFLYEVVCGMVLYLLSSDFSSFRFSEIAEEFNRIEGCAVLLMVYM